MPDVIECMERYVRDYNRPGAPVYHLYADEVDWRAYTSLDSSMGVGPEGSIGGREELFAAFDASRGITKEDREAGTFVRDTPGAIKDMELVKVRAMHAEGDLGVLECLWRGTVVGDGDSPDTPMQGHLVFLHRFDDEGLITMDHHYMLIMEPGANAGA